MVDQQQRTAQAIAQMRQNANRRPDTTGLARAQTRVPDNVTLPTKPLERTVSQTVNPVTSRPTGTPFVPTGNLESGSPRQGPRFTDVTKVDTIYNKGNAYGLTHPVGLARAQTRVPEHVVLPVHEPREQRPLRERPLIVQNVRIQNARIPVFRIGQAPKEVLGSTQRLVIKPNAPPLSQTEQNMLGTYLSVVNSPPGSARPQIVFPDWVKEYVRQYGATTPTQSNRPTFPRY